MTDAGLARHDLVQVTADSWPAACATRTPPRRLAPQQAAAVNGWAAAGHPVITRRSVPGDPADRLPVGVPLPPSLGKLRVALSVPLTATWQRAPVDLQEAAGSAPGTWSGTIDRLASLGQVLGAQPQVFGALLWQHVTGLQYLQEGSDLDLLWRVSDHSSVFSLLDGLRQIDDKSPVRIDGEVRTPRGDVNWRDLAGAWAVGGTVLVKTGTGAFLTTSAALFAIERQPCWSRHPTLCPS